MKIISIALIVFIFIIVFPAMAQDDAECDYTAAGESISELVDLLADSDDPAALLSDISDVVSATRISCDGLVFSSDELGFSAVSDPFVIPAGTYRVIVTTDDYFIASWIILDGGCNEFEMNTMFILSAGEASDGAQAVLEAETDCEVILETSNVDEHWILEFEKIR